MDSENMKLILILFIFFIIFEILIFNLVIKHKINFKWIINFDDEYPKFNENNLKKFYQNIQNHKKFQWVYKPTEQRFGGFRNPPRGLKNPPDVFLWDHESQPLETSRYFFDTSPFLERIEPLES